MGAGGGLGINSQRWKDIEEVWLVGYDFSITYSNIHAVLPTFYILFVVKFLLRCTTTDTDHNGTVEKSDFDLVAEKVCKLRNWAPGSTEYTATHRRLASVWDGISGADTDKDGHISEQEWLSLWSDVMARKHDGSTWIKDYLDFLFNAQDSSADGQVDENEFTTLYACLGVPAAQSKEAFNKLTEVG